MPFILLSTRLLLFAVFLMAGIAKLAGLEKGASRATVKRCVLFRGA